MSDLKSAAESTRKLEDADQKSRLRIKNELTSNFLVEAAAGTGKTTCIVGRLVQLIATGACEVEKLVAVTFTRKAAIELRDRFQSELRRIASDPKESATLNPTDLRRIQHASDHCNRAFVGTIHSFCASLLRERPIEFGVDPSFRELDEAENNEIRDQAWRVNMDDLLAARDPLMDQLHDLGLDISKLRDCFGHFSEYRDVEEWPCEIPATFDLDSVKQQTMEYIEHIQTLLPFFPIERGNDKLMLRYEEIERAYRGGWSSDRRFFEELLRFDSGDGTVLKCWHDKAVAKVEKERFLEFRDDVVVPALEWWCSRRYRFVIDFLRRAGLVYEQLMAGAAGLDFTQILIAVSEGLKSQPGLRAYFQERFTHILVDEFQDTDPIQAELILYLTSQDTAEKDWQKCFPKPGSLFVVGDPKQSIYRFRRGDIVTYNRVNAVFERSGGEVLKLTKNFRSHTEIREWNNRIFSARFLPKASEFKPASEDMIQGREDASQGTLFGIRKIIVDNRLSLDAATKLEAEAIARFIRNAIDSRMTVPRTKRELELGRTDQVTECDFLVIPRGKVRMHHFKTALEDQGLRCEVNGSNAFTGIDELRTLVAVLRALDDSQNPIHYLAIIRNLLFGFSDTELYGLRKAGGRLSFTTELPDDLDDACKTKFKKAHDRLQTYQGWLRSYPFGVSASRIASDLGLLASAAAGAKGNVNSGSFLRALESLRQHSCSFDSTVDLITFMEQTIAAKESEGCTALPPDQNCVRVMNLHKAKGLESPIVFLADTSEAYKASPLCHIDRSTGRPLGYMGIMERNGDWAQRKVAAPNDWVELQSREKQFLDAESDRLLYVATTRAACLLVVSVGSDKSNWSALHPHLAEVSVLDVPTALPPQARPASNTSAEAESFEPAAAKLAISKRWDVSTEPTYAIVTAKQVGLKGAKRPTWQATGDFGYQWGSAVHKLLELAAKSPTIDVRSAASQLAIEYRLGQERVDELLATLLSVTQSDIWQRSKLAIRRFSELPFETSTADSVGKPTIVRGVIDLIFEERSPGANQPSWVVVDYKTDDIKESEIGEAVNYYRNQLVEYAKHWQAISGFQVTERGIYFTRVNRYVTC